MELNQKIQSRIITKIALIFLLAIALFFSTYKLTESPQTWYDEGIILQQAINLVRLGTTKIQVAPDELISPRFVTVGYPVIYPIGLVFKNFGVGLLQARVVMVMFLLLTVAAFYFFGKSIFGATCAFYATLLVTGFAPLYGNGRTVLGEVPGLLFLLLFLFFIHKTEKRGNDKKYFILSGIMAGFCVVIKPIFIVLMPAIIVAAIIKKKYLFVSLWQFISFSIAFLIPVFIWLKTQFSASDNFGSIITYYTNPYGYEAQSMAQIILGNLARFFTEISPLYLLGLIVVWVISIIIRSKDENIYFAEVVSFAFVILILLAYARTAGWYRYFFPAQIVALLFFPASFVVMWNYIRKKMRIELRYARIIPSVFFSMLAVFHFYQVGFNSSVADCYNLTKTKQIESYFANAEFDKDTVFFIYDAPEIITFLPSNNYFQYLRVIDSMRFGENQIDKISKGIPDVIIMNNKLKDSSMADFSLYEEKKAVNKFLLFEKK